MTAAGRNASLYPKGHPAWERLDPATYPRDWLDGPRARAKQVDMLRIDAEYAARWIETVQKLVDRQLPSDEFTAAYMLELKEWERGRKREQKALHYRYDPLKREKRLIDRDIDRTLAKARTAIAAWKAKVDAAAAEIEDSRPEPAPKASPRHSRRPALHPALDSLDESQRSMIVNLDPTLNIDTTPDDEIRTAWAARNAGMSADAIEWCLDLINGTSSEN